MNYKFHLSAEMQVDFLVIKFVERGLQFWITYTIARGWRKKKFLFEILKVKYLLLYVW